jgi:hypothetical protein
MGSKVIEQLKRRRYAVVLGFVLFLAAAVRIYGFTWGRPYSLHVDEDYLLRLVQGLAQQWADSRSLNPHASSYGALPLYVLLLVQQGARLILAWLGSAVGVSVAPMLYLGRLISVVCGTATVWLVYDLGRRLYSRAAGLLGAASLAVSVLALRESHYYTVDTMVVFLITLAVWCGALFLQGGRWRDALGFGVAMGLAISTKMVAALLVAPWLAVAAARFRAVHRRERRRPALQALTGLLVAVLLFVLLNPYALLDYADYFNLDHNDDLLVQAAVVRGTLRPLYTLYFEGMAPYLYTFSNWLAWGMGLPLEALALAGVAYAVWRAARGERADWLVLGWLLPYLLISGAWYARFIRYALPLLPLLCLLAGRLAVRTFSQARRKPLRAAIGLLVGLVLGFSSCYTLAYLSIYARPDTRIEALQWMQQNIPPGSTILVERDFALQFDKLDSRYTIAQYRVSVLDHYEIGGVKGWLFHAPQVSPAEKQAYLQSLLDADYVVLGDTWRERFLRRQDNYPMEAQFYTALFSGQAGYRLIATSEAFPQLGPWLIDDRTAEQTFRLFDHPTVYILRREQE